MGRKLTQEDINALVVRYEAKGWVHEAESLHVSFVSPDGRWYDCYDRETGGLVSIDGDWVVNLVSTKTAKEIDG